MNPTGYVGATWGGAEKEGLTGLSALTTESASQTKEKLIREMARSMKSQGFNVDADTKDYHELASNMANLIAKDQSVPNGKESAMCKVVATIAERHFPGVIPKNATDAVKCQMFVEILHSLATGMHAEFLAVHKDMSVVLENLVNLQQAMRASLAQISEKMDASEPGHEQRLEDQKEIMKMIMDEANRQIGLLQNLTSTTLQPAEKALSDLMQSDDAMYGFVKRLDLKPGSSKFGDALASALRGMGTTALAAAEVRKALDKTGIAVSDYANAKTTRELHDRIRDKLKSTDLGGKEFAEFWHAAYKLFNNFDKHDQIAAILAKGGHDGIPAATSPAPTVPRDDNVAGGADDIDVIKKKMPTQIEKKVKELRQQKKYIMSSFNREMSATINRMRGALESLVKKSSIAKMPVTDRLESLIATLPQLKQIQYKNVYIALTGMDSTPSAKRLREIYIDNVRKIIGYLNEMASMPVYAGVAEQLKEFRSALDALIGIIGIYTDKVSQIWGGQGAMGGAGDCSGDDDMAFEYPQVSAAALDLDEVIHRFTYFFNVAQVDRNMRFTAKEIESYGDNYERMLGQQISMVKRKIVDDKKAKIKEITGTIGDAASIAAHPAFYTASNDDAVKATFEKNRTEGKRILEALYNAKDEFYRVVQAIDLYAKAYTKGIVTNPEAIRDLRQQIGDVDFLAKFFDRKSGELVADVFDVFPSSTTGDNAAGNPIAVNDFAAYMKKLDIPVFTPEAGDANMNHYYKRIAAALSRAGAADPKSPGNHLLPLPIFLDNDQKKSAFSAVCSSLRAAVESNAALKNIVNVFTMIGREFGGKLLDNETFMNPTQIYKALVEFIVMSSVSAGVSNVWSVNMTTGVFIGPIAAATAGFTLGAADSAVGAVANANNVGVEAVGLFMPGSYDIGAVEPIEDLCKMWKEETKLFTLVIKTMIAKTFATIGLYDLTERPGDIPSLAPVRQILGGSDDYPKVEAPAMELYVRLPLLAEYYRELFGFDKEYDAGTTIRFSMLPEMEGTFSGLIKLVFKTTKYINVGTYSDVDTKELIRQINSIYAKYASSENPVMDAIFGFRAEVNRRYGIVTKSDRNLYDELYHREPGQYDVPVSEISLLPDEEDIQFKRPSPAEQFMEGTPKKVEWDVDNKLAPEYYNAFRKFRGDINNVFDRQLSDFQKRHGGAYSDVMTRSTQYSFKELIRQGRLALEKANTDAERYEIAARLIQEVSAYTKADYMAAVMFHETVVVGLDVLNGIYQYLRDFRDTIMAINPGVAVDDMLAAIKAIPGGVNVDAGIVRALLGVRAKHPYMRAPGDAGAGGVGAGIAVPANVAGAPANVDYNDLAGIIGGAIPATDAGARTAVTKFVELSYDHQAAFEAFMETVITHGSDLQGLIEMKFADANLHLDYSQLFDVIQRLTDNVKLYYGKFRGILTKDQQTMFEDPTKVGSIYWLDKNLSDDLIRGVTGLGDQPDSRKNPTLTKLNEQVAETYKGLTVDRKWNIGAGPAVVDAPASNGTVAIETARSKNHYQYFMRAAYYDPANFNLAFQDLQSEGTTRPMLETRDSKNQQAWLYHLVGAAQFVDKSTEPDMMRMHKDAAGNAASKSGCGALVALNNLIFRMLQTSFDPNTRQIYAPLVSALVNSSLNNGIMGDSVVADVPFRAPVGPAAGAPVAGGPVINIGAAAAGPNFVSADSMNVGPVPNPLQGDLAAARIGFHPNPETTIASSLGAIIRNLHTGFSANTSTKIATESIADVPMYVRETMRANLPIYIKMFEMLRRRCEFLRAAMAKGSRCFWAEPTAGGRKYGEYLRGGRVPEYKGVEQNVNGYKERVDAILNAVAVSCQTSEKVVKQVMSDLSDSPKFMETSADFIADYKAQYGIAPMAPLSSLLAPLRNAPANLQQAENEFMPTTMYGSTRFKYLYGTRQVLGRTDIRADKEMVGTFMGMVGTYNAIINPVLAIDSDKMGDFLTSTIILTRYITDAKHYKAWLSQDYYTLPGGGYTMVGTAGNTNASARALYSRMDFFQPPVDAAAPDAAHNTRRYDSGQNGQPDTGRVPKGPMQVFQVQLNDGVDDQLDVLGYSMELIESRFQNDRLQKLSKLIVSSTLPTDRESIRIYNILDMNIVPINVHAMMRDLPLVNLYNYAWTFDTMVADLLRVNTGAIDNQPHTTVDDFQSSEAVFMTYLLCQPYSVVPKPVYDTYMGNIFRGYTDTEMGRPKYLSDQIFNKALFGEVYHGRYQWNKRGPQANTDRKNTVSFSNVYANVLRLVLARNDGVADIAAVTNRAVAVAGPGAVPAPPTQETIEAAIRHVAEAVYAAGQQPDNVRTVLDEVLGQWPAYVNRPQRGQILEIVSNVTAGPGVARPAQPGVATQNFPQHKPWLTFLKDPNFVATPPERSTADGAYVAKPDTSIEVVQLTGGEDQRKLLSTIGKLRFDSNFVRSMTFIGQIHRLITFKIRQDMTAHSEVVAKGHALIDPHVVDYALNNAWSPDSYKSRTQHDNFMFNTDRRGPSQ